MPLIYLDQNALIGLGRENVTDEERTLRNRFREGQYTLILSPTHWVETASGKSTGRSLELARFIESLNPHWLRERISLHQLEIQCFLQDVPREQLRAKATVRTITEAVYDLLDIWGQMHVVTLEDIVVAIRTSSKAQAQFSVSYGKNERASIANRRDFKAGRVTPEVEARLEREYLRRIGKVREFTEADQKLGTVLPESIPSIKVEWETTKEYWRRRSPMTKKQFHDMQHLTVAMPYVDAVLSYDSRKREVADVVSGKVGFRTASIHGSLAELLEDEVLV